MARLLRRGIISFPYPFVSGVTLLFLLRQATPPWQLEDKGLIGSAHIFDILEEGKLLFSIQILFLPRDRTLVTVFSDSIRRSKAAAIIGELGRRCDELAEAADSGLIPPANTLGRPSNTVKESIRQGSSGKRGGRETPPEDIWAREQFARDPHNPKHRERIFHSWCELLPQTRELVNLRDAFRKVVVRKVMLNENMPQSSEPE